MGKLYRSVFYGRIPLYRKEGHGYGVRASREILEKNNGELSYDIENGILTATAIIRKY